METSTRASLFASTLSLSWPSQPRFCIPCECEKLCSYNLTLCYMLCKHWDGQRCTLYLTIDEAFCTRSMELMSPCSAPLHRRERIRPYQHTRLVSRTH